MYLPVWRVAGGTKTLWFARFEAIREAEIKRAHKMKTDRKIARNKAKK